MRDPDATQILERLRGLAPSLAARSADCEVAGRLTDESMALIERSGILGWLVPRQVGGSDLPVSMLVEGITELSRACVASGWVAGLFAFHNGVAGQMALLGARELFAAGMPRIASALNGTRQARLDRAGKDLVLSGVWDYCSGVDHADWLLLAARDSTSVPHLCAIRPSDASIDPGSWNVSGMCGTGSRTVTVSGAVLPPGHAIALDAGALRWPVGKKAPRPFPVVPIFVTCLAAVLAGAADALVAGWVGRAGDGSRRDGSQVREDLKAQLRLGQAAGLLTVVQDSVRAMAARIDQAVEFGRGLDVPARVQARGEAATVASLCLQIVDLVAASAGGASIRKGSDIERGCRDIRAAASHFMLSPDIAAEMAGRVLMGLEPNSVH